MSTLIAALGLLLKLLDLVEQKVVLDQQTIHVLALSLPIAQRSVLSQQLLDARNKFQLLLGRKVLIFVK